jgi:hypothetical protein
MVANGYTHTVSANAWAAQRGWGGGDPAKNPFLVVHYPVVKGARNPAYALGDRQRDQQWYSLKVLSSEF